LIRHSLRTGILCMQVERQLKQANVPELQRIFDLAYFWKACSAPQLERYKMLQCYAGYSPNTGESTTKLFRRIFLKFSTFLVALPTKAFRFDRQQFVRLCKDTGIAKQLKTTFIDEVFAASALSFDSKDLKDPRRMDTAAELFKVAIKMAKGGKEAKRASSSTRKKAAADPAQKSVPQKKKEKEAEALLTMEQLFEALVRVAIQLYVYSGKNRGSENPYVRADSWQYGLTETSIFAKVFRPPSPSMCFQRLLDEYLYPASQDSPDIAAKRMIANFEQMIEADPKIEVAMESNRRHLRKLFKYYCDSDSGLKNVSSRVKSTLANNSVDMAADAMSVVEFLWMGQELEFSKTFQVSAPIMIQVFINSNLEEIEDFMEGNITGDLQELLQMDYEEFEMSLLQLASRLSSQAPAGSKYKPMAAMVQHLTDKMVDAFPHERLRDAKA